MMGAMKVAVGNWFFLLMVPAMTGTAASAATLDAIIPNNRGVKALADSQNYKAYQSLVEAAAADSFDPTIRLNLGLAYAKNEEYDKAAAEFKIADQLAEQDRDVRFMARFNLGHTLAAKQDIPGALAAYQAALDIRPDSLETKTNIELLWKGGGQGGNSGQKQQSKNKDDKGQGQNQGDERKDQQKNDDGKDKQKPKPFESPDLTPETVGKILEELKAQEQRVRAEHYSKGARKDQPRDKNW
jgi:Ca-activated chloride channel homolog